MTEEAVVARDPAFAEVQDMFNSAGGQKEFLDWFHNPVTRRLLMAARIIAKPKPLGAGVSSDYLLGETCGANNIIDFFIGPQNYVPRAPAKLKPLYGAPEIRKEEK